MFLREVVNYHYTTAFLSELQVYQGLRTGTGEGCCLFDCCFFLAQRIYFLPRLRKQVPPKVEMPSVASGCSRYPTRRYGIG